MLSQYQLTLYPDRPCHPRPKWCYRLYTALLEEAPSSFSSGVQEDAVTLVSQFLTVQDDLLLWTVSFLGRDSERALGPILEQTAYFQIQKDNIVMSVQNHRIRNVPDMDSLLSLGAAHSEIHHLWFCTATAFTSRGQCLNLLTSWLIVQSLMKKMERLFSGLPHRGRGWGGAGGSRRRAAV